ncbi:LysR substrate-binding domain-containing protein [Comamonas sediminis]|uniref:LysR substrate-binding domain-containing protein n=1 Tax=Comamonas sediminis TaxID=1783360 RepID=A0ABV4B3U2_9BURK
MGTWASASRANPAWSPSHWAANAACAAPSYLAKHPAPRVLSRQCVTTTELQPWTFQTGQQEHTLRVAGRLTVNRFEGIHAACMVGAGIALLSSWYRAEYLQSGRLVAIALEDAQLQGAGGVGGLPDATAGAAYGVGVCGGDAGGVKRD